MTTDELSRTFSALGDPTRRAILARLAAGEATVGELAAPFDMTFAAVSKHLRVLQDAGLVSRGRDAQYRPAKLEARPLAAASRWIGDYSRFWDDNLGAIDSYLSALQQLDRPLPAGAPRDSTPSRNPGPNAPHDKENPHG
jgi:DNA-binding transcriptional ArsR family regulator